MDNRLNLIVNFAEKGLDKLGGGLKNLVGLGKSGSRAMRDMGRDTGKLKRDLADVRKELAGASGNVTELVNRERDLERAVRDANEQMRVQRRLNAVDSRADAMRSKSSDLIGKGQSNIAGGTAMLAPLLLAGKMGAEFSSGMVDIQQKAGLTDAATDRLGRNITRIAEDAAQFPEDVRSGLDLLLARGLNVDAATAAMGPATKLATAYKVEIPDAAGAAFASLNNLKVGAADVGKVFDAMAAAGNAGGFEIADMARHFPSLTAQMAALGEQGVPAVADLSAALQVAMHTAGGADEAGNNIVNLLAKINAPGTIKKFQDNFGVNLPAAMKKLTDEGYSTLEAIAMITEKSTGGDMKKLGFAFEDRQAQMGIPALIQNMEEFRDIREEAMAADGTVDGAFDQRMTNDQMVQLRQLGVAMANLVLSAAPVLLPFLREVTAMMTAGVSAITNWAKAHPDAAGMLLKLVGGLAMGKIALGGLQLAFGGLLGPMATIYRYFGKVDDVSRFGMHLQKLKDIGSKAGPVLARGFTMIRTGGMFMARGLARAGMMVARGFSVIRSAGMLMVRGLARAGMMLLANPIFLMGALLAGIAVLVYLNWGKISGFFQSGVQRLKDFFSGLPAWFTSIGKNMMAGLLTFLTPGALTNRLIGIAKTGVTAFKNFFGIKSPSRLFMGFGGHMATGLAIGIDRKRTEALSSARRLATGVAGAAALGAGATISPAAATAQSRAALADAPVTIHVHQQPGEDAEALADRVQRKLEERKRRRRGSELGDD